MGKKMVLSCLYSSYFDNEYNESNNIASFSYTFMLMTTFKAIDVFLSTFIK